MSGQFFILNFNKLDNLFISSGISEICTSDISNDIKLFKFVNVSGNSDIFGQFVIFNSNKLDKLFISSGISGISPSIKCNIVKFLKLYNSTGNSYIPLILNAPIVL